ncbi:MAG: hypothetical protein ABH826_01110 [Patescibacteria group bacterium]
MNQRTKQNIALSLLTTIMLFAIVILIISAFVLDKITHKLEEGTNTDIDCVDLEYTALLKTKNIEATITKPAGWTLEEADAGGVSSFILTDSEDENIQIAISFHQPIDSGTQKPVAYSQWLMDNGYAIATGSSIIGVDSIVVDFYPTSTIFQHQNSLVAELDSDQNIYLEISSTETTISLDEIDLIKNSLNINPSSDELLSAAVGLCK